MKLIFLSLTLITVCLGCNTKKEEPISKKELPSAEMQIKLAVLAAPQEKRDSCTVLGYSPDKQLIILRKGTNELICLADNPDALFSQFTSPCHEGIKFFKITCY